MILVFSIRGNHITIVIILLINGHIGNNCDFGKIQYLFGIEKYQNTYKKLFHSSKPMSN
jgi:hypothetical protein